MGILLKNGEIVTASDRFVGDIYCDEGKILAIGQGLEKQHRDDEEIDASGQFIFPGGIDAHVHMDRADPVDPAVGLFNGVRITPTHYNQSTAEWLLEVRFLGLTAPGGAFDLRFIAELTDARNNVLASAPFDVSAP